MKVFQIISYMNKGFRACSKEKRQILDIYVFLAQNFIHNNRANLGTNFLLASTVKEVYFISI
jgi:hypothetical protein